MDSQDEQAFADYVRARAPGLRLRAPTAPRGATPVRVHSAASRGAPAQHLADLVNALPIDRGGPRSRPADNGRGRKRLVIHGAGGDRSLDGFFCGVAVLDGRTGRDVVLDVGLELTRAVDATLGSVSTVG